MPPLSRQLERGNEDRQLHDQAQWVVLAARSAHHAPKTTCSQGGTWRIQPPVACGGQSCVATIFASKGSKGETTTKERVIFNAMFAIVPRAGYQTQLLPSMQPSRLPVTWVEMLVEHVLASKCPQLIKDTTMRWPSVITISDLVRGRDQLLW